MSQYTEDELKKILDQHEPWIRAQPGATGTSVGLDAAGQIALKVYSNKMPAAVRNTILERLRDYPTAIEETGEIRLHKSAD